MAEVRHIKRIRMAKNVFNNKKSILAFWDINNTLKCELSNALYILCYSMVQNPEQLTIRKLKYGSWDVDMAL